MYNIYIYMKNFKLSKKLKTLLWTSSALVLNIAVAQGIKNAMDLLAKIKKSAQKVLISILWSRWRESDPHTSLGKAIFYHWITSALL